MFSWSVVNPELALLRRIFTTEKQLFLLTERQLLEIASALNLEATIEDLKRDTVAKIWRSISTF